MKPWSFSSMPKEQAIRTTMSASSSSGSTASLVYPLHSSSAFLEYELIQFWSSGATSLPQALYAAIKPAAVSVQADTLSHLVISRIKQQSESANAEIFTSSSSYYRQTDVDVSFYCARIPLCPPLIDHFFRFRSFSSELSLQRASRRLSISSTSMDD